MQKLILLLKNNNLKKKRTLRVENDNYEHWSKGPLIEERPTDQVYRNFPMFQHLHAEKRRDADTLEFFASNTSSIEFLDDQPFTNLSSCPFMLHSSGKVPRRCLTQILVSWRIYGRTLHVVLSSEHVSPLMGVFSFHERIRLELCRRLIEFLLAIPGSPCVREAIRSAESLESRGNGTSLLLEVGFSDFKLASLALRRRSVAPQPQSLSAKRERMGLLASFLWRVRGPWGGFLSGENAETGRELDGEIVDAMPVR